MWGPQSTARDPALSPLLGAYLLYSVILALVVWRVWRSPSLLGLVTHAVDLTLFSLLAWFSGGAASPYYPLFVFGLVGAAIRWQKEAVLWTGCAALVSYLTIGIYSFVILEEPRLDLDLFVIRLIELSIVTLMLGFLRGYLQKMESGLRRLADWSGSLTREPKELLENCLKRASEVLGVEHVALLWEEPGKPHLHLAVWDHGVFTQLKRACPEPARWIPSSLRGEPFFWVRRGASSVAYLESGRVQPWTGYEWGPGTSELAARKRALCVPLAAESIRGFLIAVDPDQFGSDILAGGQVTARMVASQVDQLALWKSINQRAADQERMRLARELHDGVAQSLAGAALQLEAARRSMETDLSDTKGKLNVVKEILEDEQRHLRRFILQSRNPTSEETALPEARVSSILRRIEKIWGLKVDITARLPLDEAVPPVLASSICGILQEALHNAARHSGATRVEVSFDRKGPNLQIWVRDNGRGFPFEGSRDLRTLLASDQGPREIRDRVSALKGELLVVSSPAGSSVCVELPLGTEAA